MGTPAVVLLAVLAVAACPWLAAAHGSLYVPRPRNWVSPIPLGSTPAPWYTFPSNINGVENFGNGHGPSVQKPAGGPGASGGQG
jgi:hypothetical protein